MFKKGSSLDWMYKTEAIKYPRALYLKKLYLAFASKLGKISISKYVLKENCML